MSSSYSKNSISYEELFKTISWLIKPSKIIEFGILNGYSLKAMVKSNPLTTVIDAYDIFERFNGNAAKREIIDEFKPYSNVTVAEGDFYEQYKYIPDNSVDIIHIDIANDGSVYEFAFQHYIQKLTKNGIILMEGGSEERDQVEWMKKYNKVPITSVLSKYKNIYDIITIQTFPSLTIIKQL